MPPEPVPALESRGEPLAEALGVAGLGRGLELGEERLDGVGRRAGAARREGQHDGEEGTHPWIMTGRGLLADWRAAEDEEGCRC